MLILLLQSTLTLLDPQAGVWASARTAEWGNQTFVLQGLQQPVVVIRDGNGTTHIFAQDDPDLFFAQGYTQASDRLFQMEAESLTAQGNLSSWLGSSALASDEMYRYLGVPQAAVEMSVQVTTVNPQVGQDMKAYVAGVNAYISWAESHNAVPFQFKVLGVSPYTWSLFASFCFDRLMVIGQTTGFTEPMYAAVAEATTGDPAFDQVFPIYPQYWQNYTVLPGNGSVGNASLAAQGISANYLFSLDWFGSWATGLSGQQNGTLIPLYRGAIANLSDPFIQGLSPSAGVGSNSWVVAANHSALDQPMLANDPHLPLMLPSLWVSTQLVSPDYDVEGWSLAGLLGVLIGHNTQMAWALTNSEGATALDYVETLQGNTYLENATWHPLKWTNETISVAGGSAVPFDLAWTSNGPIVARMGDLGLSIRWAGTGPTWEAAAELDFDRAQSIPQFESALQRYWTVPNLNAMLIARNASDPTGQIGWIIPARVLPDRRDSAERSTCPGHRFPRTPQRLRPLRAQRDRSVRPVTADSGPFAGILVRAEPADRGHRVSLPDDRKLVGLWRSGTYDREFPRVAPCDESRAHAVPPIQRHRLLGDRSPTLSDTGAQGGRRDLYFNARGLLRPLHRGGRPSDCGGVERVL